MASLMNPMLGNQATHHRQATGVPKTPSSHPVCAPAACARSTRRCRADVNGQRRAPAALKAAHVVVDKPPPSVESDSEDKDDFAQSPPEIFTGGRGHETDYVVVGSGIGGLCTAAMLAKYGYKVTVCEAHYHAGGAAHGFDVRGYKFDAGPSFFLGLTGPRGSSSSPLKQVLDAVSETVETKKYKKWICYTPGGRFEVVANREDYLAMIERQGGPEALAQWLRLEVAMKPLQQAAGLFPAAAMRADPGVVLTSARFLGFGAAGTAMVAGTLTGPFSAVLDRAGVTNAWLRSFMDLECFVLSGMTARETLCAEMVYMFAERNAGRNAIEYPIGGSAAIVAALVRGIEKFGGRVMLRTPVEQIMVENGKATGVLLGSAAGRQRMQRYPRPEVVTARRGVISNASVWDTQRLLPQGAAPEQWRRQCLTTPQCDSFVHLHLGIDATGLPADLECHHLVVNSWDDLTAPQNVCIASIPTVFDPSMAPPGKAVVHAYYAANEPYSKWEGVDRNSKEYRALKEQRAEPLWKALERFIPDVRDRAELVMVGTPLTHERFLRRSRGSYGPAISASGGGGWPGPKTPVPGLYVCGDSCMPGIGVPAAAASGLMCANTLAPVWSHLGMMSELLG